MLEEIKLGHDMFEKPWWRRGWGRWLLIWAIWTFVGLVFTLQYYFTTYRSEKPTPFSESLYVQMTWSYLFALATPLVLWATSKLPLERKAWLRNALLHLPLSIVLSVSLTALGFVLMWLNFGWGAGRAFSFERMGRFKVGKFREAIGMYMLIALSSYAFSYYRRFQQGELNQLHLEAQLSQSQLQALKMQLHPHFLFNTLHSISALLSKDTELARKMIARLGDFLRMTLENSGTQEVTLLQEMEFLRCYLAIERIRFEDRLTTHIEVASQALNAKVPNLILQPIVENAIRHGIAPRSTPGRLEIHAKQENGILRIRVRDNGAGLPDHRTPEILFQRGLGLANTEARLDRLYGSAHRLDLANDPDGGVMVTLEVPFKLDGKVTSNSALVRS
jgi:two-component system LytT family sensor kinase